MNKKASVKKYPIAGAMVWSWWMPLRRKDVESIAGYIYGRAGSVSLAEHSAYLEGDHD